MKRLFCLSIFIFSFYLLIYSVKAYPFLIDMLNTDGSFLSVFIHGDENFRYMTTIDGYLVEFNEEGIIEYAFLDEEDRISTYGIKANNKQYRDTNEIKFIATLEFNELHISKLQNKLKKIYEKHIKSKQNISKGSFPLSGNPKSIVILANFTNRKFHSKDAANDFSRMLNQHNYSENGATGSAKDYFRIASYGKFSPDFVVVGPYDLPHDIEYYGAHEGDFVDKRPGNLIVDACRMADNDINFNDFDIDEDGFIDNVFVYYAGYNEAEGAGDNTIWPHRSTILSEISFDGVKLHNYACTSELKGNKGRNMCAIGTFCHEFGHVLSLPDFYATNYSEHPTLGSWDIMDVGSYNNESRTPPTYSALERFLLGWLTPQQISNGIYCFEPISISNTAYIISMDNHSLDPEFIEPEEFFFIENRNNSFEYDGVPANGMLITHVVYNKYDWIQNKVNNSAKNMGVKIHTASGNTDNPELNPFPGSDNVTSTVLLSKDNVVIDTIKSISKKESTISFQVGHVDNCAQITLSNVPDIFNLYYGEEMEQIYGFDVKSCKSDIIITVNKGEHFKIKSHDGLVSEYGNSVIIKYKGISNFHFDLDILFAPQRIEYLSTLKDQLLIITDQYESNVILQGVSKRKVYVVPPVSYNAENITPYSFTAVWNDVFDAQGYYLSVFTLTQNDTLYVKKNEYLSLSKLKGETRYDITGILPKTDYIYRVQASDRDSLGRYENITEYSNEIKVRTLDGFGIQARGLDIVYLGNRYVAYIPKVLPDYSLYIYSVEGRLMQKVTVESNVVDIPELPTDNIYIIKYANDNKMERESKVGKIYYNLSK